MRLKKHLLPLLLSIAFVLSGCANTATDIPKNTVEIPAEFAYTLRVTINPELNLYMDNDNKVLAVEYLNDDAEEAFSSIRLTGVPLEDSLKHIIEAAIDKDYLKDDKDVNLEVKEIRDTSLNADVILNAAHDTVEYTLTEKLITANVITKDLTAENDTSSNPPEAQDDTPPTTAPAESTPTESSEPNTEVVKANCSRCGGSGECQGCHGGRDACPACGGTGYETCPMCDAGGLDHGQTCATCGGSHHYVCTHCGGAGTAKDCPECGGSFKCPSCGGTGKQ